MTGYSLRQVGWLLPEGAPIRVLGMEEMEEAGVEPAFCEPLYVIHWDGAPELLAA